MEINKQLFEDVLSGKLKGMFILRNGEKVKNRGVLTRTGLGTMATNLLSSYNDKFGK